MRRCTMDILKPLYERVVEKNMHEVEYLQAVSEVLDSLECVVRKHPEFIEQGVFERLVEPERQIMFRVTWVDDQGRVQVNRGYRIQQSSVIGPYKGGIRFHPSVNLSIMKCLAFEQTLKNALTGLPLGGGKGGSDFDPKGKSDGEIMRFCQSFMTELYRHIGSETDIPAGDIGVGMREIGYMYGMYKKLTNEVNGAFTGKGLSYGGSFVRKEATGYGLCYFMEEYLNNNGLSFTDSRVVISGSGNVAIHAAEKVISLGGRVVALSDSNGVIRDEKGIDLDVIKEIKLVKRERIKAYLNYHQEATYYDYPKAIWSIPCDIALPCATQNELDLDDAINLVKNGCKAIGEGANMPSTREAIHYFLDNKVLFAPAKAANAGGVACSGLEMTQNSMRLNWSFNEVDHKLKEIMINIYRNITECSKEFGEEGNLVLGANIYGFLKVADAMVAQGII